MTTRPPRARSAAPPTGSRDHPVVGRSSSQGAQLSDLAPQRRHLGGYPRSADKEVDLATPAPGTIRFTCGLGMYSGIMEVIP